MACCWTSALNLGCNKCIKSLTDFLSFSPSPTPSVQGTNQEARTCNHVLTCASVLNKFPSTTPGAVWAVINKPVKHTTNTANDTFEDDTDQHDTNRADTNTDNVSPAAESPEVAPEPMATPAAAAPATNDSQALQDTTTAPQDTTTTNLATAIATVYRRRTGPKAASKPLADYSLLAPHMRQMEVEWVKKDKAHIDALKACRLQVANCSWYQEIHN